MCVVAPCAGVVLTCGKDDLVKVTDARSFQVTAALRAPGFHMGGIWCKACLGPDERHIAAGSSDGTLFIWQVCVRQSENRYWLNTMSWADAPPSIP